MLVTLATCHHRFAADVTAVKASALETTSNHLLQWTHTQVTPQVRPDRLNIHEHEWRPGLSGIFSTAPLSGTKHFVPLDYKSSFVYKVF